LMAKIETIHEQIGIFDTGLIFEGGSSMLLAAAGEAAQGLNFDTFDIFMILFTILSVFALIRSVQHKNKFAAGFSAVVLLTFLFSDFVMMLNWFNLLDDALAMVGLD
jgi:uncharacterized membrane protein